MIVFLHIPKTAGSTFQFILENSFGISACHTNHTKKERFTRSDFDLAREISHDCAALRDRHGNYSWRSQNYRLIE